MDIEPTAVRWGARGRGTMGRMQRTGQRMTKGGGQPRAVLALVAVALAAAGCDASLTGVGPEAALLSVVPEGGAENVDPNEPVVVSFDHAMSPAMTEYAALHEGDINGPEVAGTWSLSADSTALIFEHPEPLAAGTLHTIHLGGNMMDAKGHHVDLETHGTHMGGEWADGHMMGGTGGMHGGGHGGSGHPHMGDGWQHPENGSYGMIFTFTTAD